MIYFLVERGWFTTSQHTPVECALNANLYVAMMFYDRYKAEVIYD